MDPLVDLKDIHLPPPVDYWHLSFGWYLMVFGCFVGCLILLRNIYHRRNAVDPKQEVLQRLAHLRKAYEYEEDPIAIAIELSQLLRRVAMIVFPHQGIENLKNENWLAFLDRTGNTLSFSQGVGRALVSAPYQSLSRNKVDALFNLATMWLKQVS